MNLFYIKMENYLILLIFLSPDLIFGREVDQVEPKLADMDVVCSKSYMTVRMSFSSPFNGLVYSRGKYDEKDCMYVCENSATMDATFDIYYDNCGTINDVNGRYYENTIIIQHNADILGSNDQTKRLRCEWHDVYQTSITQPVVRVSDPEPVVMNFQGDNIDCWMEILEGKSPWSRKINGIVTLGSPMTLVVAMRDKTNQFDMRVKTCFAHDGHKKPIYLTDEFGCVQRTSLMSQFKKIRDVSGRATVMCYSHFNAFKFPDSIDVYMQCTVEICRYGCTDTCGDQTDFPSNENLRGPPKLNDLRNPDKDTENNKIRDLFETKLRDIYTQRLKRLRDKRLKDLRNKRLRELRNKRLKNLRDKKLKNQDLNFKDVHGDLLEDLRNLAWKESQNSQETQKIDNILLKNIHDPRFKDLQEQILNELTQDKNEDDRISEEDDEDQENNNQIWNDNRDEDINFKDEETNVRPITFITSSNVAKTSKIPTKLQPRNQSDNRTVKEIEVFSSISVPAETISEVNIKNVDEVVTGQSWPTLPPHLKSFSSEPISPDPKMDRQAMLKDMETQEMATSDDQYMESESRPKIRQAIPVSPEFARWLSSSNGRSLFKRTPPRVKLSLVSKTGRVLMRKYFYPISPMAVIPPPRHRHRQRSKMRFRMKRSTDEIGISRNFKVVSPQDLAFDPSTIKNDIYEGHSLTTDYSFCFAMPGIIGTLCFLILITFCSLIAVGYLLLQYRSRRHLTKTDYSQDTNMQKSNLVIKHTAPSSQEQKAQNSK